VTLARAALGLIIALSRLETLGAGPCAPRAALDGDPAVVARVAVELRRLGVAVEQGGPATPGAVDAGACRRIRAAVEPDPDGGIAVSVRDASQRSEGRVVSDAVFAATWIDSWVSDGFVPIAVASERATAAPGDVALALVARPGALDRPAPRAGLGRITASAGYERTWSLDGSTWSGVGGAACMHFDAFCVGVRLRYAAQDLAANLTAASRRDLSALATASWSHAFGQTTVTPELGLGVGRMTTDRIDSCAPPPACDPTSDPSCMPAAPCVEPDGTTSVYVGDHLRETTYTPRLAAALRVAVPLFGGVWLDGLAAISYAPFAHTASFSSAGQTVDASGNPIPADQLALPGEPEAAFQLGIGIRVGAP